MSYTFEKLEQSKVKFSFTVSADDFATAIEEAYQKTKHKYAIGGFRKGKVPKKVIENIYGTSVFYEDAMDIIMPRLYEEALSKETSVDPVSRPEVGKIDVTDSGEFLFDITVTVKPEVELGEYKGLKIKKPSAKVKEEDINRELENARQKQARVADSEGPAVNGSILNIDFSGSIDGVKFDGGTAEGYDLELGSGSFIPGFEEQLIGAVVGDEKDVVVTFPETYHATDLAGKEAVFACKVHSIKSKELPALDDEFAKDISEFDTIADYKDSIKKKLKADAEKQAEVEFEEKLVDAIVKNAKVEVPASMIEDQIDEMVNEFEYRLSYQGLKMEDYLKFTNKTAEEVRESYREASAKQAKNRLVLEEIAKKEDIQITAEDMDEKIKFYADSMGKSVDEFKKGLNREQLDFLANQIISDKLIDLLKSANA